MNLTFCNTTADYEEIVEIPLWHDFTFHQLGLILSATFGLFATILSLFLIFRHATHYLKPYEQKHIIRILFMVPIYSVVSFLSYKYYIHSIYFEVIRDCYESIAIASFFALLCHYVAPELHDQKEYFRELEPMPWVWPLTWFNKCCGGTRGWFRTPRSGLTWFNVIFFLIFQYCLIRVLMTLLALGSQLAGRYCLDSLSPLFVHVWVTVIESISVTFAMFCLIQFYIQLRVDLANHRPFLKVLAIKLVIFLSFWQSIIINFLTSTGVIKESPHIATPDVKIGIPAMLLCMEMAIFSVLHLVAYPWKVYDVTSSTVTLPAGHSGDPRTAYAGGFMGYQAILDALNVWDIIKAIGRSFRWVFVGRKTREQDKSYTKQAEPFVSAKKQEYELVGAGVDSESVEAKPLTPPEAEVGSSLGQGPRQPPQRTYVAYKPQDQPAYVIPYYPHSTPYPDDPPTTRQEGMDERTPDPGMVVDGRNQWEMEDAPYPGQQPTRNKSRNG